ncbi:glycosyltransferase [Priestia megaterium]|uniref:glycosyltransferase n=1 Tax=Priestia megaterium TaxID=1404 RepID=UPI00204245EC|nr:glycosyltransferase [Priestia megaterium]MCM3197152.1 glycosyltransferase [Priestia megaterium]
MNPKVSIIIPFYNCAYVDQAIQSALDQTYQNIEIIVVDDGSTMFTEKIDPFRERIVYLKKENGGTATALNHGIRAAKGEYIAWLSSDDYFLPQKISQQISFMLNNKGKISFTKFDCIDKDNQIISAWDYPGFSDINDFYRNFLTHNAVNGCTVIIKKDLFEHVGYFNPFFRYTHDYELWFRLLIKGYKMYYLDEPLTKFRVHEESGTHKHTLEMQKEMALIESHYRPLLIEYIISKLCFF